MSELERFAQRLREEPGFSRNRRFDELSSPESQRLRRRLRRLAGIARELSSARSVSVHPDGDGYRVTIHHPAVRAWRETWLTAEEHALLLHDGHLSAAP